MSRHVADTIVVTVDAGDPLVVTGTLDGIFLNGSYVCGTPREYESLQIIGGPAADNVTLNGSFAPGRSYEADFDELEVTVSLGGGNDTVSVELSNAADNVRGEPSTLWLNADNDGDMTLDAENVHVYGRGGNDTLDFTTWTGGRLFLHGGSGIDYLYGSPGGDRLYGDEDNDLLLGFGGADIIYDGPGNDAVEGGDGNDRFEQGAVADVGDIFFGDAGSDTISYALRTNPVAVNTGDSLTLDGEAGEDDIVHEDVEKVIGGSGDDTLVGYSTANTLTGGPGNDELYGGGGVDTLYGGEGDDHLVGEAAGDKLYGDPGNDTLEGGAGKDALHGGDGNDVLDGGAAADSFFGEDGDDFLYNADGTAETVDCGAGTDDPEPDGVDTFIDCELI